MYSTFFFGSIQVLHHTTTAGTQAQERERHNSSQTPLVPSQPASHRRRQQTEREDDLGDRQAPVAVSFARDIADHEADDHRNAGECTSDIERPKDQGRCLSRVRRIGSLGEAAGEVRLLVREARIFKRKPEQERIFGMAVVGGAVNGRDAEFVGFDRIVGAGGGVYD